MFAERLWLSRVCWKSPIAVIGPAAYFRPNDIDEVARVLPAVSPSAYSAISDTGPKLPV
ncbi:hypothetical protein D3C72_1532720 [compost metagenome]